MIEGKAVLDYFEKHPEARAVVESTDVQYRCWRPEFGDNKELYWRKLTVEDVKYISVGGWCGEPGIFAWYYPEGVPHYLKIADA